MSDSTTTTSEKEEISNFEDSVGISGDMPDFRENIVRNISGSGSDSESGGTEGARDVDGEVFDPSIHFLDSTGKPAVTKAGKYKKRPLQGKKCKPSTPVQGSYAKPLQSEKVESPPPQQVNAPTQEECEAAGICTAELIFVAGRIVGGEPFEPTRDERSNVSAAFARYYAIKGIKEIPPEYAILLSVGMYVGKRWNTEPFATRRVSWWKKIWSWLGEEMIDDRPKTSKTQEKE